MYIYIIAPESRQKKNSPCEKSVNNENLLKIDFNIGLLVS